MDVKKLRHPVDLAKRRAKAAARARNNTRTKIHEYWQNPDDGAANAPDAYLQGIEKSEYLKKLLLEHGCTGSETVLEVGCNVGRNLNLLHEHGFDVTGIEISQAAVDLLRREHPRLADSTIHVGPAERILPTFGDASFDVVFTMAVLQHIHPDSAPQIFDEIARVCGHLLIVIENEEHGSWRSFARNYRAEFERRGFTQADQRPVMDVSVDLRGYTARAFTR